MRFSWLILSVAALTACASQPEHAGSPPIAATPVAATVAPAASAATADTNATAAKRKAPAGYELKEKDGQTVYCQDVTRVGTRFTTEVCMTEAQYEEIERRSQSMRESMQKPVACAGASCTGG